MKCCICGNTINGYGNNPYPLCKEDDFESRCCDECDSYVIKARIGLAYNNQKMLNEVLSEVRKIKKH